MSDEPEGEPSLAEAVWEDEGGALRAPTSPDVAGEPPAADAPPSGPVIKTRDLTVYVPGKFLLLGVKLEVQRGERILLVGPSGAGKSVLLKLLTGLLPPDGAIEITGEASIGGHSIRGGPRALRQARQKVGIVFQDPALLDELSARGNLHFARDHAHSDRADAATEQALEFLTQHQIDPDQRVSTLSGGQKQRVALARALARDPEVVFYDEPTSALDPRNAQAVADLINQAALTFGKTSIVVTHNYAPFREYADRILYLDPEAKRLREIDFDELEAVMAAPLPSPPETPIQTEPALKRAVKAGTSKLGDALAGTTDLLFACFWALILGVLPLGARLRWFGRWFWHYARLVFVGSAIPYNMIAGVIAGFVTTYYTYEFLPRPDLSEPLILDDVLPALGFALYRIIVPVLVTLLVAGRTGAALASDFGSRVYHQQTQSMTSMGAPVGVYLGTASLWASLSGVLVVGAIAFWVACLTSLAVTVTIRPDLTPFYWNDFFWRRLEPFQYGVMAKGWEWVLTKLLVSAAGVCAIAYAVGTRPKQSAADVSRGITLSVYWGTVFVLLVHFVIAFFEFEHLRR